MDGLQFSLGSLSFPLSLSFSLLLPLCASDFILSGDWNIALVILTTLRQQRMGPLLPQLELKNFKERLYWPLLGCRPTLWTNSSGQYSPNKQNRNRHSELGNCEHGVWTASSPRSRIRTTSQLDLQTVSLTSSPSRLASHYRGPTEFLSSSRLPGQSGSRLGKDLRFLSHSCHLSSVFMGKLPNLWEPQLPPL